MSNQRGPHNDYEPIDCGIHDQLLERATLRIPTEIEYHNDEGETMVVQDVIDDVFSHRGAEYLRLSGGVQIRLDRIVRFSGRE